MSTKKWTLLPPLEYGSALVTDFEQEDAAEMTMHSFWRTARLSK